MEFSLQDIQFFGTGHCSPCPAMNRAIGAIRLEDLVIVTEYGCNNLNRLSEGLDWK